MTAADAYTFVHLRGRDSAGHAFGRNPTPGRKYSNSVREIDGLLGRIFAQVQRDATFAGPTTILLPSDHGGSGTNHGEADVRVHYTVPFYVWGASVAVGADLYALNASGSQNPGSGRPEYSAPCSRFATETLRTSRCGCSPSGGAGFAHQRDVATAPRLSDEPSSGCPPRRRPNVRGRP